MTRTKQIVDTNILLRFLTGDPPDMAAKVKRLIERADTGEVLLVISPLVVAETFYTLESFYELERKKVAEKLLAFLGSRGIETVEFARVADALTRCHERKTHFADAYVAAASVELKHPVASFDHDFDRFKGVVRVEPKL